MAAGQYVALAVLVCCVHVIYAGWWSVDYDDSCYSIWDSCYPRSYPTIKQLLKFNTVEERIKFLSKVSVPNACRDWINWNRCEKAKYDAAEDHCKEWSWVKHYGYWITNMTNFLDYLCVQQIDRLVSNQHCLADFELASNFLCCNVHEYYSTSCSEDSVIECAQELVSVTPGCSADAAKFVRDIGNQLSSLPLYRLCPYSHGRYENKAIKKLF